MPQQVVVREPLDRGYRKRTGTVRQKVKCFSWLMSLPQTGYDDSVWLFYNLLLVGGFQQLH